MARDHIKVACGIAASKVAAKGIRSVSFSLFCMDRISTDRGGDTVRLTLNELCREKLSSVAGSKTGQLIGFTAV